MKAQLKLEIIKTAFLEQAMECHYNHEVPAVQAFLLILAKNRLSALPAMVPRMCAYVEHVLIKHVSVVLILGLLLSGFNTYTGCWRYSCNARTKTSFAFARASI